MTPALRRSAAAKKAARSRKKMKLSRAERNVIDEMLMPDLQPLPPEDCRIIGLSARYRNVSREQEPPK